MKKIALATIIALTAGLASAAEVGVNVTRDYSGAEARNAGGVTLGQQYGKVSVTAGFDRFTKGDNDQDRYSLVAGYDVAKVSTVTFTPKVGVAYLNNQVGQDGYAMTVGVGATLPLTKQISFGLDFARQYGQDRVKASDGNTVTAGLKYRF
jgi:opacity protein-like surface antigen